MNSVEQELLAELDRQIKVIARIVDKYPDQRAVIAYGMLGAAIAVADSFGVSAEDFLVDLRRNTKCPAPKGRQS